METMLTVVAVLEAMATEKIGVVVFVAGMGTAVTGLKVVLVIVALLRMLVLLVAMAMNILHRLVARDGHTHPMQRHNSHLCLSDRRAPDI